MYGSGGSRSGSDQPTLLEGYIERACSPMLSQPNMSLNLEIADLINMKKANTPREAAMCVLHQINRRNTHISMLALHLLDILVKNCGYPFHLQISTKEFLNELVRRFPEKPPIFPPPPMQKILELIHEWKLTICVTSKHKEDLVHVRDMHRLLGYKGYRFPEVDRRSAQVLNESDQLKSAEELEEEDRAAQSAKLQELIRRGTPKDLAAAQELMKIMSGAEPDKQPNYEAQMQKELDRVQSRVLLLNELLNNAQPGEKFVEGDAFDQLSQKCKQVQPKLQKWIGEASGHQPEMMDRLLLINDLTNNILERYIAFKAGDYTATAEIDPAFSGQETTTAKSRAKEVSLIDFEDPASPTPGPDAGQSGNALGGLLDDLIISGERSPSPAVTSQASNSLPANLFFDTTLLPSQKSHLKPSLGQLDFFSNNSSSRQPNDSFSPTSSPNPAIGAISLGLGNSLSPASSSGDRQSAHPHKTPQSQQEAPPSANRPPPSQNSNLSKPPTADPFADLAGLF